jgi:hypothetical protein
MTISILDGRQIPTKTSLGVNPITAGNIVATETAVSSLKTATEALIDGVITATSIDLSYPYPYVGVADGDILRGRKWAVTLQDQTSGRFFVVNIPTAKMLAVDGLMADNSGNAILTATEWAAWKALVEAAPFKGPAGGSIKVIKARLVSRS